MCSGQRGTDRRSFFAKANNIPAACILCVFVFTSDVNFDMINKVFV